MPSELSKTEKDKYCMITLICIILKKKKKNLNRYRDVFVFARGWRREWAKRGKVVYYTLHILFRPL